uniref:Uncharacterized protein n=1 Tax=Human herpesvirus 1 TaxID=10298 RepID=A0A2Z4GZR7_HHV1|nr:hypothetical protein [Human alphaherpesvirus 1]
MWAWVWGNTDNRNWRATLGTPIKHADSSSCVPHAVGAEPDTGNPDVRRTGRSRIQRRLP